MGNMGMMGMGMGMHPMMMQQLMMQQQQQMNMMQVSCYSALQATPTEHARAACGTWTLDLYDVFNFKPECFVKLFELH